MQLQAWTTSSVLYGPGHGAHSAHQTSVLATEPSRSPIHLQDSSQSLPSVPAGRLVSQQLPFPSLTEASVSLMVSCLYFLPSQHPLRPPALFNNTHTLSCTPGHTETKVACLLPCPMPNNLQWFCLPRQKLQAGACGHQYKAGKHLQVTLASLGGCAEKYRCLGSFGKQSKTKQKKTKTPKNKTGGLGQTAY